MNNGIAATSSIAPYAAILVLIGIVGAIGSGILVLTHILGPKRKGPIKHDTYESGMPLVTDARRRFNVRFYIVALLFLLFDVEVVILWPWALVYYRTAVNNQTLDVAGFLVGKGFVLGGAIAFLAILLVGFLYEMKRGAFKWN